MTGVLAATLVVLIAAAHAVTTASLRHNLDRALRIEADAYSAAVGGASAAQDLATATRAYLRSRGTAADGLDPVLLVAFSRPTGGLRVISNSDLRLEDAAGNIGLRSPRTAASYSDVDVAGSTYRVYSVPVMSHSEQVGVFQAALPETTVSSVARRVALTLVAAGLAALAIGVPLSYFATRGALAPLRRMAIDTAEITPGEPGRRIPYEGPRNDELATLAGALNEMVERLERANAEQRRFIADASHELRTPVAIVRGNVELLRSGTPDPAELDEGLSLIESEAVRMTSLLDQLLALARLEDTGSRRRQPLDVSTLAAEVRARAASLGDREFVSEGDCDVWVEGDPDLLDQALVNLVKNAVAHTTERGRVVIGCRADTDSVAISVTDDGPGLSDAELERVFDRFFRGGSERAAGESGFGLGLAITRRLVELHGGTITAENVAPHGARFTITLPTVEPPADISA